MKRLRIVPEAFFVSWLTHWVYPYMIETDRKGRGLVQNRFWRMMTMLCVLFVMTGCTKPADAFSPDLSCIREDTEYLCDEIGIRVTGTEKERETADWIMESLRAAGFSENENLFRLSFESPKGSSENVIAICNPDCPGPIFSVVAHYDSVETSAGARDNAASVAGLLEIARYLGTDNTSFPCQIRMVFLGSEENGYHGSRAYVESLSPEERKRHAGAFNMDISASSASDEALLVCNTLGAVAEGAYLEGNFIVPAEGKLTEAIRQAYRELYGRELGGVFHFGESDHVSFHNAQLEAVNVCWRKASGGMPVLPESYHKPEDTPEDLDYETVGASIRCIVRAIRILTD